MTIINYLIINLQLKLNLTIPKREIVIMGSLKLGVEHDRNVQDAIDQAAQEPQDAADRSSHHPARPTPLGVRFGRNFRTVLQVEESFREGALSMCAIAAAHEVIEVPARFKAKRTGRPTAKWLMFAALGLTEGVEVCLPAQQWPAASLPSSPSACQSGALSIGRVLEPWGHPVCFIKDDSPSSNLRPTAKERLSIFPQGASSKA